MARLKTVTLGCKVNQYETELVREGLLRAGYADAAEGQTADLCVVNTCTVTAEGDAKSRQTIRRLARDNPASRIVVMGCYATRAPQEVAALPNVAEVVTDKRELPDLLGRFGVVDVPNGIGWMPGRRRAYVKVQDGCLLRCTYCVIPYVRPVMHSRRRDEILDEVRRLVDRGYREIVLTGIHLGHYGVDRNWNRPREAWERLAGLARELASLPGDFRIRLSSIEATEITRELLDVMGEFVGRICPHLHVCLQSGSDAVLARMKRRWGAKRFLDRCRLAQETLDRPALTTDVIVGFPGETDEDFERTLATCREAGFAKIHAFPFSPRRGTPAAELPGRVEKAVQQARTARLADLERELRRRYLETLLETPMDVMVETDVAPAPTAEGFAAPVGTTCRYVSAAVDVRAKDLGRLVPIVPRAVAESAVHGPYLLAERAAPRQGDGPTPVEGEASP